jgi:hypothetical protein
MLYLLANSVRKLEDMYGKIDKLKGLGEAASFFCDILENKPPVKIFFQFFDKLILFYNSKNRIMKDQISPL